MKTLCFMLCNMVIMTCVALETTNENLLKRLSESEKIDLIRETNLHVLRSIPDSKEWKIERICNMNVEFIKSCSKAELKGIVPEVFATIPQEAFPMLVEELASNVFNRTSMGFKKDDDSLFNGLACKIMLAVYKRCRSDMKITSSQRRIALAALTFIKASEGIPNDFSETMLNFVPDTVRDIARNEWFPKANENPPSYAPIMDSATNDTKYAKSEKWNDDERIRLRYPSSEHHMTKVQTTMEIEKSTLLLNPSLEDDNERSIPPEPEPYPGQGWYR